MSDGCGNSDDSQASTNVSGGGGGGDNTEDWALRDKNYHDFSMIPFCASFGFKPPQNIQMPVCPHSFLFFANFNAALFKEMAAETSIYVIVKISEAMPLKTHLILVGWEDITTGELGAFHGVMLNIARHVKCSIKDFFCEQWLDSS
jgi:hypothetical protein